MFSHSKVHKSLQWDNCEVEAIAPLELKATGYHSFGIILKPSERDVLFRMLQIPGGSDPA